MSVPYRNLGLTNIGVLLKTGQGNLNGWLIYNTSPYVRYVKFYDIATAPDFTGIPLLTLAVMGLQSEKMPTSLPPVTYLNGLGLRCTTGPLDNDNGLPGNTDVIVNIFFT